MFERAKKGWILFKETFGILKREKSLLMFPLLSGIIILLVLGLLFFPVLFIFRLEGFNPDSMGITGWIVWIGVLFIICLLMNFISSFFKAGIVSNATSVIEGRDPLFMDGIRVAAATIKTIFAWSVIAATVGVVLQLIRTQNDGIGRLIGTLIAGIAGAVWELVTFFVIPVMIFEKKNAFSSIKESWSLFKKTWGETVVAGFSFVVVYIPFFIFMIGTILLFFTGNMTIITSIGALAIIVLVITVVLVSALQGILVALLYHYAKTGEISSMIEGELITSAFVEKKTKISSGQNNSGGQI